MAHMTVYNEETKIIETKLHGEISATELIDIIRNDTQLAARHNCFLWLNDYSDATFIYSTADIYHFPAVIQQETEILGESAQKIKRASVSTKITDDHHFEEAMAKKNDQHFHAFTSIQEARKWLLTSDLLQ